MQHQIPRINWHMSLINAIEADESGDTIVCHTQEMKELGERARKRMAPDKPLRFVLETDTETSSVLTS